MKNLDIEKLERKNIYEAPENFFEQMQANVLQQTAPKKKTGQIIKLNWAYAAAAAVTLLFGVTFFITQDNVSSDISESTSIAVNDSPSDVTAIQSANKVITEENLTEENSQQDLTIGKDENQIGRTAPLARSKVQAVKTAAIKRKVPVQTAELQMDQVLANFPIAELADLGKNAEQDVYLDLYN
ncbi:MAG: hypothetical protein ACOH1X_05110 [Kaistella sp.]